MKTANIIKGLGIFFGICILIACSLLTISEFHTMKYYRNQCKESKIYAEIHKSRNKNPDEKILITKKALEKYGDFDPFAQQACYNIGRYYETRKDYNTAIKYFEKCMKIGNDSGLRNIAASWKFNILSLYMNDYAGAIRFADEIIERNAASKDKIFIHSLKERKNECEILLGYYNESINEFKDKIAKGIDVDNSYLYLINTYIDNNKYKEAFAVCNEFLEKYDTSKRAAEAALLRERAFFQGDYDFVIPSEIILRVVKNYDTDSSTGQRVKYALAESYIKEGRKAKALKVCLEVFNYKMKDSDKTVDAYTIAMAGKSASKIYKENGDTEKSAAILKEVDIKNKDIEQFWNDIEGSKSIIHM